VSGRRRVVVTGLGAVTPLGGDVDTTFERLLAGDSGVAPTTRFDTSRCPVKTAGQIDGFDVGDHGVSARDARALDRYQHYVLAAGRAAIEDAKLNLPNRPVITTRKSAERFDRIGVAIGVAFSSTEVLEREFAALARDGTRGVSPRLFNMALPNAATSLLSVRHGLGGPLVTVSGASASGSDSVIAAYEKIRCGRAEVMLAGGAESPVTEIIVSGFARNGTGSVAGACRAFDRDRDGTVLGEGAVVLVLEELDHAVARGARRYGEILGYGLRGDAFDMSDIPPASAPGLTACLREALDDAGIAPTGVDYLNVHGTATPSNDPAEITALRNVFGRHADNVAVSGSKGATGHMLGASGAFEIMVALLATHRCQVPPTHGLVTPGEGCQARHVTGTGLDTRVRVAISTSVGMGGNNSAVVLRGEVAA